MKLRTLLAILLFAPAFAQESQDQLLRHWVYDITYSSPVGDRGAAAGPNGGLVAAYLVVPSGKGPFPAVIYGHWCMPGSEKKNRTEFLDEALVLAHSGVISL